MSCQINEMLFQSYRGVKLVQVLTVGYVYILAEKIIVTSNLTATF